MSNCVVVWNELTNEIEWFADSEDGADLFISQHQTPDILYKVKEKYIDCFNDYSFDK